MDFTRFFCFCLFLLQLAKEECKSKKPAGVFFHYFSKYVKLSKVRMVKQRKQCKQKFMLTIKYFAQT